MASINSITGSLSSTSSLRGFGGLASGLERDELIEQLTYGTRTKIEKQQQQKDKLGWQQTAIRNVIDKVYDYTNKYTSYASSTNLTSSNMFSRTDITAVGDNSKYVSVTGRSTTADTFSIKGIKQLAEDARIAGATASGSKFSTAGIDSDIKNGRFDISMIAGQSLTFKHGNDTYSVTLGSGDEYNYTTDAGIAAAINKSLESVEIRGDKKLSDVLSVSVSNGRVTFENKDKAGNTIEIKSGTGDALKYLGILGENQSVSDLGDAAKIKSGSSYTGTNRANVIQNVNISEYLNGSTMTFNYNGTSKTIQIGGDGVKLETMADLQADIQKKLNEAFGKGRVAVELSEAKDGKQSLSFKTTKPDGTNDPSSVFGITGGTRGMLGKSGLLGIDSGTSNKVNTSQSILESGLNGASDIDKENDKPVLKINGIEIKDSKGNALTWDSSIDDIMKAVNENKEAGVTISYQRNSDRFIITSKEKGASGNIELEGNIAEMMFGASNFTEKDVIAEDGTTTKKRVAEASGKDAIVSVQFAGDSGPTEIVRDSNSFSMDGLTVGLKGTFGYKDVEKEVDKGDGTKEKITVQELDETAEAITFDAKVDSDNTTKVVKEMIDAYNEIVELINKEVKTKPNRKYEPLTASQREDMSESEIKAYEEKAKEGLLFSDTDLRSFADALRFVLPTSDRDALSKIGISVSSSYSDNGKLVLDETKFKAALESDPETVSKLFTRTSSVDEDGNKIEGGLMEKISNVMKTYAGTTGATKGILVERAGSSHAPTTILKNSMQTKMDDIDDVIDRLLDRLEMEEDRYISQFTTLETLMSQMNSQSSYLSQLSGY